MYLIQLLFHIIKNNMLICSDIDNLIPVVKKEKLCITVDFQYHQCQEKLF